MQVARHSLGPVSGLVLGLMMLIGSAQAYAAVENALSSYTYHSFNDVDAVSVSSHFMRQGIQLDNGLLTAFQLNHETLIVPAIDASIGSEEAADAITTASRPIANLADAFTDFVKVRNEMQGSVAYRGTEVGYYVSNEVDYFAQMIWTSYNRGFLEDNLNLSAGLNYSWDRIKPLADVRSEGTPGSRNTVFMSLVATQVLTPTTVLRAGVERSLVEGLQHNPYRKVYAGGGNAAEIHPFRRGRNDVFVRVSQYIKNGSSVKVDYRYYTDDWSLDSHTVGAKLTQYITEKFVVRYRYRYYRQSAAWFFRNEYQLSSGIGGYLTGDYRLGEFDAHLFGSKVYWNLSHYFKSYKFIESVNLTLGYERYFNSTNFTANIFETGLEMSF